MTFSWESIERNETVLKGIYRGILAEVKEALVGV